MQVIVKAEHQNSITFVKKMKFSPNSQYEIYYLLIINPYYFYYRSVFIKQYFIFHIIYLPLKNKLNECLKTSKSIIID